MRYPLIKLDMEIPKRMSAAVLRNLNNPLEYLEDIEIPKLLSGQVLVKIFYSGICGSQLMEISGGRGEDRFLPHLLGHEASGEVVQVSDDVHKVKPGDTVILSWIRGEGLSAEPAKFSHKNEVINSGQISTLSNYSVVSENSVFKFSGNISKSALALFGCAIPTGAGIIINQIQSDQDVGSIAIFGLGGVGLSALFAAKSLKPKKIFAIDLDPKRLEEFRKFVDYISINPRENDPWEMIMTETDGAGVNFAIDASGEVSSIQNAFKSLKKSGGTCIVASHPRSGHKITIDPFELISGKKLIGTWGGMINLDEQILALEKIYLENKNAYDSLTSNIYELKEINVAVDDMKNSKVIRPIIKMSH